MDATYNFLESVLSGNKYKWCVTGAAGFIGSHLVEALLKNKQQVVGIDSLVTGKEKNIEAIRASVGEDVSDNLMFYRADINDTKEMRELFSGCDFVLHQAALGSVPRSMKEPILYHQNNVVGTVSVFEAARLANIKRVVYASSSSVYGDNPDLPKVESKTGSALSPYALSKQMNELDASLYARVYGLSCVGLRYFNVFGPRQDPGGAYAAVIPKWVTALAKGNICEIYGDGTTSRDFSPVPNIVLANILVALSNALPTQVFNVGLGQSTSLKELFGLIRSTVVASQTDYGVRIQGAPVYQPERAGDIKHSCADISSLKSVGYKEVMSLDSGIELTVKSFI
jgi:UDP-N-acetylglucosamine 4-epimerase